MTTVSVRKRSSNPLILTSRDEAILRAIYQFRYMTSLDVAHLPIFSPKSLTHVREILSVLAGRADHQTHTYLLRFPLPTTASGNRIKVFALGVKGRDFLTQKVGLPLEYYRPYKLRHFSYSHILHHLTLTRFVVAANHWCRKRGNVRLAQTRLCYELARVPGRVPIDKEATSSTLPVPDAWLLFERNDGKKFPVLLEIDRGTEHSRKFRQHVRTRIEFIKGGHYSSLFGTPAVIIAYATTGETPEYRDARLRAMCAWTQEVLADLHMENWSSIFRFASVVFDELYTSPIFEAPVWYRPDSSTPLSLFTT